VLLVDAVGELGAWWGTAQIAFVGGSLTQRGGQNMIEPAAYGAAVSFGPNTHNFRDVVERLLAADAACVVGNAEQLADFVGRCLADPDYADQLGCRARQVVASQLGATDRTIELLARLLEAPAPRILRAAPPQYRSRSA
jgi:3-deoxy-D-manno-octulosonic-acid transferase